MPNSISEINQALLKIFNSCRLTTKFRAHALAFSQLTREVRSIQTADQYLPLHKKIIEILIEDKTSVLARYLNQALNILESVIIKNVSYQSINEYIDQATLSQSSFLAKYKEMSSAIKSAKKNPDDSKSELKTYLGSFKSIIQQILKLRAGYGEIKEDGKPTPPQTMINEAIQATWKQWEKTPQPTTYKPWMGELLFFKYNPASTMNEIDPIFEDYCFSSAVPS